MGVRVTDVLPSVARFSIQDVEPRTLGLTPSIGDPMSGRVEECRGEHTGLWVFIQSARSFCVGLNS